MKKYAIVGGGTAGWLTALFMKKTFPDSDVTLIRDKEIGIIGVGEATTPHIVMFLNQLGIDPIDVLRETNGTFKVGINFENWNGDGKKYLHSFSDKFCDFKIPNIFDSQCNEYYTLKLIKDGLDFKEYHYPTKLAYANKVDLHRTDWALHFDATKCANYLEKVGISRGINLIESNLKNVVQDEQGYITQLNLNDRKLDVDFVFDCSGFHRVLIGGVYKEKWLSYSNHLPMKKGIPFWLDTEDEFEPYTSAIAMKYGWMWKIPLQHRTGSGYIFDSDYIDENQALEEAEQYFGRKLEIRKIIPFDAGRYENFWVKNCMAVGLSSAFIEPLESTSLFVTVQQLQTIRHFANELGRPKESSVKLFNEITSNSMDNVLAFVYLHYLTKRDDSDFWKNFRLNYSPPKRLLEIFDQVKENNMRFYDIFQTKVCATFDRNSYLQVCHGLEFFENLPNMENYDNVVPGPEEYKKMIAQSFQLAQTHKKIIQKINSMGNKK
jgi:tryptophan halogenase